MSEFGYSLLEQFLFPVRRVSIAQLSSKIREKNIVITGATFGIGEATARLLAQPDVHLILVARTKEKLENLEKELQLRGSKITCIACDLYQPEDVTALIDQLQAIEGGIDIFINNAGKSIHRSIWDSLDRPHDFTRTMQLNYLAPVAILLGIMPLLIRSRGQIIHISAVNTLFPAPPRWAAYQASKTAMREWAESTGPELSLKGITTTLVYLPLVKTRMIAPNKAYDNSPAMQPGHVAHIVAAAILNRKKRFMPWWLPVAKPFVWLTKTWWQTRMARA